MVQRFTGLDEMDIGSIVDETSFLDPDDVAEKVDTLNVYLEHALGEYSILVIQDESRPVSSGLSLQFYLARISGITFEDATDLTGNPGNMLLFHLLDDKALAMRSAVDTKALSTVWKPWEKRYANVVMPDHLFYLKDGPLVIDPKYMRGRKAVLVPNVLKFAYHTPAEDRLWIVPGNEKVQKFLHDRLQFKGSLSKTPRDMFYELVDQQHVLERKARAYFDVAKRDIKDTF